MSSLLRRVSGAIKRRHHNETKDRVSAETADNGSIELDPFVVKLTELRKAFAPPKSDPLASKSILHLRIAVHGARGVGRFCFMRRLALGEFPEELDLQLESGFHTVVHCLNTTVLAELVFNDEIIPLMSKAKKQYDDMLFLTYNVGNRKSFDDLPSIYENSVLSRREHGRPVWQGVIVVALANDLAKQPNAVSRELGAKFARSRGFSFRETSAKTGYGCTANDYTAMIEDLVRQQVSGDDMTKLRRFFEAPSTGLMVNVAILGARGIGKTSFVSRLNNHESSTDQNAGQVDYEVKRLDMLGGSCLLRLRTYDDSSIDNSSDHTMERYDFLAVMYNAGDLQSALDMREMYGRSVAARRESRRLEPWYGTIVVALASDLSNEPNAAGIEQGRLFAQSKGAGFHETSAKEGLGCSEADFVSLTTSLLLQQMGRDRIERLRRYLESHVRDIRINVLCLGDPGIGKKCFLRTMCLGKYSPGYDPTGLDISGSVKVLEHVKWVHFQDGPHDLSRAGPKLGHYSFGHFNFVIMAYKISDPSSFASMQRMYEQSVVMRQEFEPWHGAMIVGLASDLADQPGCVKTQQGLDYANLKGIPFRETSAKNRIGCTAADLGSIAQDFLLQFLERE